ncbi:MAG: PBSX family phage terminase large subunit [Firmicutes bacterium]|nr:PBSX family phage terminase large subunit [Bacillota bacterium]MDY2719849.1 PBSX family phage terminase large subunit [Candidatus Faecousia sp.]
MTYSSFSAKQKIVLSWWTPKSPYRQKEAIICDGAVRSGKTLCMSLGFFLWAMSSFDHMRFGVCGKTIASLRRNVLTEILPRLEALGFRYTEKRTENLVQVRYGGRTNDFYIFGGRDESSASLIQGITFAGILLDEVVLMPRSFVEQACARCSVAGSRLWFSCNPEGPLHWFYQNWIQKADERNCLYLHFTMEDNPSLSDQIRRRYQRLYSGVFYRRFVLGQWVAAEGRVYDFFDSSMALPVPPGPFSRWYISCDYGTVNPASFGLWGCCGGVWYRVREFYFDSRLHQRQMTDAEYADALKTLAGDREIAAVIVDPSAASFLELLRRRGWNVRKADNDVLSGIRRTSDLLKSGRLVICDTCTDCLREIEQYVWDESSPGRDKVKKQHDHAMDDMRYFAATVLTQPAEAFSFRTVERRQ